MTKSQFEDIYKQAASLFDTDTTINTEADEYQRGVCELVMMLTGQGSDDLEEIASTISDLTSTAHLLTAADFGTGINGDLLYIGPYKEAKEFIKGPNKTEVEVTFDSDKKLWFVKFDGGNVWGAADTLELAWRYALAAELGPIDDEFVPFRLK